MTRNSYLTNRCGIFLLPLILSSFVLANRTSVSAQAGQDSERERALALLWQESRAEDALPLLEKLAQARPNDREVIFSYGMALLGHAKLLKDPDARKQTRVRARNELLKAKDLGLTDPLLFSILESLSPDGGKDDLFSKNEEADAAMRDGEASYVRGDFATAARAYEHALEVDPKLYEAALFAGDMYFKLEQNDKAAYWYMRATKIDPDRETAYRYSATPFLKAGKLEEARTRYIEAVIAEPYNRLTWAGLDQWAKHARVTLKHPRIDIPKEVIPPNDNRVTINMLDFDANENTGLGAWNSYGIVRAAWAVSEFAKAYPNEKTYRHSLREEATALRLVVEAVKNQQREKKIKQLDPSLANLVKLSDDGLLEPFILFALADKGIAEDYFDYRKMNREKLRRYLMEYVTSGRGD